MAAGARQRLDVLLAARGLARSRSEARDLILRRAVTVAGVIASKPGELYPEDAALQVTDGLTGHVSRAALKLTVGLDRFAFLPEGLTVLDIGASTGGFTQVLLARGAARVYAVDVGHGQLAPSLRADPRLVSLQGVDARALSRAEVPEPPQALVADVSFISLRLVLPVPLGLLVPGAWAVLLVKPQFELGPAAVKRGVVRDGVLALRAVDEVAAWLEAQPGWVVDGHIASPIRGREGNTEFLIGARHRPPKAAEGAC